MTPEWETAAKSGDAEALAEQLASGADADARDRHGQTALMLASHAGHLEAVRVLISGGAALDHRAKFGLTATMLAVVGGHKQVAIALARAGADLTVRGRGAPGFADKTAAELAREGGNPELAAQLEPDQTAT